MTDSIVALCCATCRTAARAASAPRSMCVVVTEVSIALCGTKRLHWSDRASLCWLVQADFGLPQRHARAGLSAM